MLKQTPIQINYRDYKNFNTSRFNEDLRNRLNRDESSNSNYNRFQNILREVLDNHAPMKNKYNRANNSPFMTKQLRKLIMNRSRCKNTYFKTKTAENWEKYRKLRNACVKLTKRVKKDYFHNLNIKHINDNKAFWKTVKPFLSSKGNIENKKIILVENEEIIRDDKKNADIMNDYFVNVTKSLDIPEIMIEQISMNIDIIFVDPIDAILHNFYNHSSIIKKGKCQAFRNIQF